MPTQAQLTNSSASPAFDDRRMVSLDAGHGERAQGSQEISSRRVYRAPSLTLLGDFSEGGSEPISLRD